MSIQPDVYYRNLAAQPQQSRRVIVLALLSKLALVLLLGVVYAGVRFMG